RVNEALVIKRRSICRPKFARFPDDRRTAAAWPLLERDKLLARDEDEIFSEYGSDYRGWPMRPVGPERLACFWFIRCGVFFGLKDDFRLVSIHENLWRYPINAA